MTANGSPLDIGNYALNSLGYAEDQPIQLTPGNYNIVANYPGDPSYAASTGSSAVTVAKAPTTVSVNLVGSPVQYGVYTQINVSVSTMSNGAGPSGTFSVFDSGTQLNVLTGLYPGKGYDPNASPPYASNSAYGAYNFSPVGQHTLAVQYSGDANYAASSVNYPFTVVPASTYMKAVSALPSPTTPSLPVTLTAEVQSSSSVTTPTGTITFYDNGVPLSGTVSYGGQAGQFGGDLTYTFTQVGTHSITASYSGDTNYTPSTSIQAYTLTVYNQMPTSFGQLYSTVNPPIVGMPTNLVAMVQGSGTGPSLTGTISFTDNGSPMPGTVAYLSFSSGGLQAQLPVTFNALGSHNIVAQYSGDQNYAATQAQLSFSVRASFGLIIVPPATNTVTMGSAGGSGSLNLAVAPAASSVAATVNLSCSSSSTKATCNVTPGSVITTNGANAPFTVNYTVPALGARLAPRRRTSPWALAVGFVAVGLLLVPGIRRRPGILVVLLSIALIGGVVACGGSSSSSGGGGGGPVKQSYVFTVTGTDANNSGISANTTFTVTVQ